MVNFLIYRSFGHVLYRFFLKHILLVEKIKTENRQLHFRSGIKIRENAKVQLL